MRIAMVAYGDITHDSRVQREADSLARAGHSVTIFCLAASQTGPTTHDERVEVVVIDAAGTGVVPGSPSPFRPAHPATGLRRLVARSTWLAAYARTVRAWGRAVVRDPGRFDAWHVHDFAALVAVAGSIPRDATLVYDVHDLFTETGTGSRLPGVLRSVARRYERRLVRRVGLVVAVNGGIADVVERQCHPRKIIVVHNCPPRWTSPEPRPNLIREQLALPQAVPLVLYHGLLSSQRGLERLCDAMLEPGLERAHLALLGYGQLREALVALSREPRFGGRIHVLDAVLPEQLMPWVASADVGSMAMPRDTLNLYLSTPNKLFECLAAGTPVVVSDFPAVRRIVVDDPLGPLGAVCDPSDTGDVARAIASVIAMDAPSRDDLRRRCLGAASERWNWEAEASRLVAAYDQLAADRDAAAASRSVR
jgi:alpha-maltose-1-phosphate synthase